MLTVFFSFTGPISVITVLKRQNAKLYVEAALKSVVKILKETKPARLAAGRVHLDHNNTSSHTSAMTRQFLKDNKVCQIEHPLYSPDLARCHFWLFPKLSENLAGVKFQKQQNLTRHVKSEMRSFPFSEFSNYFSEWINKQ